MSADLNVVNPNSPKRILMVASNPAISEQTAGRLDSGGENFPTPTGSLPRVDIRSTSSARTEVTSKPIRGATRGTKADTPQMTSSASGS